MLVTLVQLSLSVITVIQLTSSQSTYDVTQQDSDVSSCGRNEQVLSQLVTTNSRLYAAISQLTTTVSQLTTAVSQLQRNVTELKTDVTELKTGIRQKDAMGNLIG